MLSLANGVKFGITGLKIIDHPSPLLLIGSDVLSGGRPVDSWNFTGIKLATSMDGVVTGNLCFAKAAELREAELVNVPTAKGSHAQGTSALNMINGPPLGG